MGKILFWVVVIVGVLFVTRLLTHYAVNRKAPPPSTNKGPRSLKASEEMVRCAHCQVYTPRSEAIKQDNEFWCSPEHAKKGMRHPL